MKSSDSDDETSSRSQSWEPRLDMQAGRLLTSSERGHMGNRTSEGQPMNASIDEYVEDISSHSRLVTSETDNVMIGGFHALRALEESIDLPAYVKEHNTTLTFPEKVRTSTFSNFISVKLYITCEFILLTAHAYANAR